MILLFKFVLIILNMREYSSDVNFYTIVMNGSYQTHFVSSNIKNGQFACLISGRKVNS